VWESVVKTGLIATAKAEKRVCLMKFERLGIYIVDAR
jgi:hypothetical protein